ncbi:hypothetical protein D3C76_1552280 [compost metagenome]
MPARRHEKGHGLHHGPCGLTLIKPCYSPGVGQSGQAGQSGQVAVAMSVAVPKPRGAVPVAVTVSLKEMEPGFSDPALLGV